MNKGVENLTSLLDYFNILSLKVMQEYSIIV